MSFYFKKSQAGQSLIDICMQEYGAVVALPLLLEDNQEVSLASPLREDTLLKFQVNPIPTVPINRANLDNYRRENVQVNTHESAVWQVLAGLNIGYDNGLNQLRIETGLINLRAGDVSVWVDGAPVANIIITNNLQNTRIDAYPSPALVAGNTYAIAVRIGYGEDLSNLTV